MGGDNLAPALLRREVVVVGGLVVALLLVPPPASEPVLDALQFVSVCCSSVVHSLSSRSHHHFHLDPTGSSKGSLSTALPPCWDIL